MNGCGEKGRAAHLVRHYKLALTVSQVVRLIGLLLVFVSQNIVHDVRDEMAEFVVPLRKEINLVRSKHYASHK